MTELNLDPRHRGTAGLGLEVGIRAQEPLVDEIMGNLGALHEARQRVRHLTLGLAASRSLWQRRVPADPGERLWLLGPALGRLLTPDGSVGDLATADSRTVPRGTFSAAARRVLRAGPGPHRDRRGDAGAGRAAGLGQPPAAAADQRDRRHPGHRARAAHARPGAPADDPRRPRRHGHPALGGHRPGGRHRHVGADVGHPGAGGGSAGEPGREASAMGAAADHPGGRRLERDRQDARPGRLDLGDHRGLGGLHGTGPVDPADADMIGLLTAVGPLEADDPSLQPIEVDALAAGVSAAFDPSGTAAPAATRVLATISGGVDPEQPLAPPEPCVGLDRPAWEDLAAAFPEWLLPGIGQLPEDCVIGLESNGTFIDAYMAGLNTQLLSELRWRNIPVATGCTPIRRFWDRSDTSSGERADDVVGVASWPTDSALGDASHRAPGATGRELVIAVRGQLLLRYPTTLVYLQSAVPAGAVAADFDHDPDDAATRVLPAFHGRIGADVVFYGFPSVDETALAGNWLVFEEPPAGYRFRNDVQTSAATGHDWAVAMLAQPVRVLIRGDSLVVGGTQ